jgi:hypothetical protein
MEWLSTISDAIAGGFLAPIRLFGRALHQVIDRLHRPEPSAQGSDTNSWNLYLDSLKAPRGPIAAEVIAHVRGIMDNVRAEVANCRLPITQPTEEGAVQLAWDDGVQYLEVEVLPAGRIHWYFRNRRSQEVLGTEDSISCLPPEFFEKLRLQTGHSMNGASTVRTGSR